MLAVNQTCTADGFGCQPRLQLCNYTIGTVNGSTTVTVPCHELCVLTINGTSQTVLCDDNTELDSPLAELTAPWAQSERDAYWVGNDWDWRSQKSFGDYPNDHYDTFQSDLLHGGAELLQLARDLLLTGSDFHTPFHYGDSQASADLAQLDEGSRRRLEAWGAVQQLQAGIDLAFGIASNRTAAWTRRLEESEDEEESVVRIHAVPQAVPASHLIQSCGCCSLRE